MHTRRLLFRACSVPRFGLARQRHVGAWGVALIATSERMAIDESSGVLQGSGEHPDTIA
jgi:hypothetical protein